MSPATIGVEEEFLLADPRTGRTVADAEQVLGRCVPLAGGARIQRELRPTQLESATGICTTSRELRAQLITGRRALAAAAGDLAVLATGTPVSGGIAAQPQSGDGRYGEIDALYDGMVTDYEACGCHVHIGVPDPETAVAVVNHLARWLPVLLALSANSPSDHGRDTGYHSWRMVLQSRFPGSGVAPFFSGHAEYRRAVDTLVSCGALADPAQTFWLARPSPHFPTVEFRVADVGLAVEDAILQALLSRALVQTALADLDRGQEAEALSPQVSAAAVWTAARYGLTGFLVDPARETRVPAWQLVETLVDHVRAALDSEVTGLLAGLLERGTGSVRQRAISAHGIDATLRLLRVTAGSPEPVRVARGHDD